MKEQKVWNTGFKGLKVGNHVPVLIENDKLGNLVHNLKFPSEITYSRHLGAKVLVVTSLKQM